MTEKRNVLESFLNSDELAVIQKAYVIAEQETNSLKRKAILKSIKNIESMCRYFEIFPEDYYSQTNNEILYRRIRALQSLITPKEHAEESFRFILDNGTPTFITTIEVLDNLYYQETYNLLSRIAKRIDTNEVIKRKGKTTINKAISDTIDIYYGKIAEYLVLIGAVTKGNKRGLPLDIYLNRIASLSEEYLENPIHSDYVEIIKEDLDVFGYEPNPLTIEALKK